VGGRFVGLSEDNVGIGETGVGDEQLLTVQEILVAILGGGGLHADHVAARIWLCESEGAEALALQHIRQVSLVLVIRAVRGERPSGEAVVDARNYARGGAATGQFFDGDAIAHHIGSSAALFGGKIHAEKSEIGHFIDDVLVDGVVVVEATCVGHEASIGEFPHGLAYEGVFVRQLEVHEASTGGTYLRPKRCQHRLATAMLERIPTVLTAQEILDMGFGRAARIDIFDPVRYHRIRKTETARLCSAVDTIADTLIRFPSAFPNLDNLRDYPTKLLDILVGVPELKKSLGSLKWASDTTRKIGREATQRIANVKKSDGVDGFFKARKWAYGRISSVVQEVSEALEFVAETRDKIRILPTVSPDYATVVIAGYPNVGKTSLLKEWTNSNAEINTYAFTTKQAEVGHFEAEDAMGVPTKYQVVDTPGLLDRPEAERNKVEQQAVAAVRHAADAVLFLIDPTEICGYDLEKQEALLAQVRSEMEGLPFLVAETKADMESRPTPEGRIRFSTVTGENMDVLKNAILTGLQFDELDLELDPLATWREAPSDEDGWY
jgi:nucleolar GTP-binding protein